MRGKQWPRPEGQDEQKRGLEELEKVSHAETKKVEDLSAAKEKEILELK